MINNKIIVFVNQHIFIMQLQNYVKVFISKILKLAILHVRNAVLKINAQNVIKKLDILMIRI